MDKNHTLLNLNLKNYFIKITITIYYYIETFLSCNNFFYILLVFVSFLQTYCEIYSFRIPFSNFFIFQISFCIYLLPALSISLYYFHVNLFFYLVSNLCFSDNKLNQCSHSFFIYNKKKL